VQGGAHSGHTVCPHFGWPCNCKGQPWVVSALLMATISSATFVKDALTDPKTVDGGSGMVFNGYQ
jgi:hypothetical protein